MLVTISYYLNQSFDLLMPLCFDFRNVGSNKKNKRAASSDKTSEPTVANASCDQSM